MCVYADLLLPRCSGDSDTSLTRSMLIGSDELDGAAAALRDRSVVLQRERAGGGKGGGGEMVRAGGGKEIS